MIKIFKGKDRRHSRVWWWWQEHTLYWWWLEGGNVERDKLREIIHSYKSRSFCNSSQIRKVYMKKVKSRHKERDFISFSKSSDSMKNANTKFQ